MIAATVEQIEYLERELTERFLEHPDSAIYISLPGIGVVLGSRTLGVAGATTVEGEADASVVVVASEGAVGVTTPLTIPRTAVPASGPMAFVAHGTACSMVFSRQGDGRVTAGGRSSCVLPRGTRTAA